MKVDSLRVRIGRALGVYPRAALPSRYQDGWQAHTPCDETLHARAPEGFAAFRRGIEILVGSAVSTPILEYKNGLEVEGPASQALAATPPADLELACYDAALTGNGWLHIERDDAGLPKRLIGFQASRVTALVRDNVVVYLRDGIELDMADTVHIMLRNSTSPYLGDALAESYSTSLSLIAGTCSIVSQINSNASHVEAIISTETPLTGAQMNELRQAYDRQASAAQGKLGGVVIMSAGMKPSSIRRLPTALEADVANVMNFSVAEASRITGVPLGLLGVKDSNAYNSAVEAQRAFYRSTLRPLFHRIEAELSAKLGANLKFDSVELTLGSGQERAETISKLLYCGAISLDEARTALGYGKTPGGDVHGVPANQVPLPAWLKTPIPQAALAPTKTKKTEL